MNYWKFLERWVFGIKKDDSYLWSNEENKIKAEDPNFTDMTLRIMLQKGVVFEKS